jgi:glutathione S-transferase
MMTATDRAVSGRDYLLGKEFSMADVIFGGTVRYMLMFKLIETTPAIGAYAERLAARPAARRADEMNAAIAKEHGLKTG